MNKEDILPAGRIIGVHGIKGEVKVLPYGDLGAIDWGTAYLTGGGKKEPCRVKRVRPHKGSYIFELEGFATRNDAERLVGLEISLKRNSLPPLPADEYYYSDLIGVEVFTDDGRRLGRIVNIIATGGADVLEVEGPPGGLMIPASEESIVRLDLEKKKLTVRLIEGLLNEGSE